MVRQSINYFLGMLALFVLFAACTRNRTPDTGIDTATRTTTVATAVTDVTPTDVSPASAPADPSSSTRNNNNAQSNSTTATPLPPATAVPASEPADASTFQYTVESGDTLFSIAEDYGTDVGTVQQLNNFLFDETIRVGELLRLPLLDGFTEAGRPTSTPVPFRYPIQSGDTLSGIAQKFGISASELVNANSIVDTDSLYVGQEIVIPGRAGANVAVDSGTTRIDSSPANQAVHIVRPGEGLLAIAERYNVSASEIATANSIQNRELLRTGQRLFIPGISASEADSINTTIHTVVPGQGLLQIAVQYGVDVDAIIDANNILNTELIYPGQELVIP